MRANELEPENKRIALTITPEEVPQSESDQGCEPAKTADEGVVNMDIEDWLIDFQTLFLDSSKVCMDYDLFILSTCMDCVIPSFCQDSSSTITAKLSQSSSPTAGRCLQLCAVSSITCCDIKPPASDAFAPSWAVDLSALPWLLPSSSPPETLVPSAPLSQPSLYFCHPTAAAGSSLPSGSPLYSASTLGYSGSTSDTCHCGIALISLDLQ